MKKVDGLTMGVSTSERNILGGSSGEACLAHWKKDWASEGEV